MFHVVSDLSAVVADCFVRIRTPLRRKEHFSGCHPSKHILLAAAWFCKRYSHGGGKPFSYLRLLANRYKGHDSARRERNRRLSKPTVCSLLCYRYSYIHALATHIKSKKRARVFHN